MSDTEVGGLAVDRLRSLIERIERLEEEQKPSQAISATCLPKPNQPALTSKLCVPLLSCAK